VTEVTWSDGKKSDRAGLHRLLCFPGSENKAWAQTAPQWQREIQSPAKDLKLPMGSPWIAVVGRCGADLVGLAWGKQDAQTSGLFVWGIAIHRDHHGRRLGGAAFGALVERATLLPQRLGLDRLNVTWLVHRDNEASLRMSNRLGTVEGSHGEDYQVWSRAVTVPAARIVRQADRKSSDRDL
jgi:RimJ/RimL family protein N-acetyltransferase